MTKWLDEVWELDIRALGLLVLVGAFIGLVPIGAFLLVGVPDAPPEPDVSFLEEKLNAETVAIEAFAQYIEAKAYVLTEGCEVSD